jgi:hypothetical protein
MTTLFTETTPTPETETTEIKSYLDHLVGEGKKFATVEDLAKGKWESDEKFIPQLLQEKRDMEKKLATSLTLEEFLTKQTSTAPQSTPTPKPASEGNVITPQVTNTISEDKIKELVQETFTIKQKEAVQSSNLEVVRSELQKVWGKDYLEKISRKAKELSLDPRSMDVLAATNPKAFLAMINPQNPQSQINQSLPPASSRSVSSSHSGVKDQAYWDKIRKEDRSYYYSADGTAQRHRDAREIGDAFFKR